MSSTFRKVTPVTQAPWLKTEMRMCVLLHYPRYQDRNKFMRNSSLPCLKSDSLFCMVHRGEHHQRKRNSRYFMPLYRDTDSEINQLGHTSISTNWGHLYRKVMTREIHHKYSKFASLKCVQTIQLLGWSVSGRACFTIYHQGIPTFKTFREMWWTQNKLLRKHLFLRKADSATGSCSRDYNDQL